MRPMNLSQQALIVPMRQHTVWHHGVWRMTHEDESRGSQSSGRVAYCAKLGWKYRWTFAMKTF